MDKRITNPEKLPVILENHVTVSKTWVDKDNIFNFYYYMDSITDNEKQLKPERTLLEYNGSSYKKNIPNGVMHQDMIDSSKEVEFEIKIVNEDFIGWHEQYYIMLHNWPHSRKPNPKTGKYHFGDNCYNKHARGMKRLGFVPYHIMVSYIQLEKLIEKVIDHENPDTPKAYEDELKSDEWYKNAFKEAEPYPKGNYIQGRDQIASITSHVTGLVSDFNLHPTPEFWRNNGFQYHFVKDDKELIIGGNSRGRGFIKSAMRDKGMYSTEISEEDIDVLTLEDLEYFSAWLNKRTSLRQKFTNRDTLESRLYNTILKGGYLTRPTKDAGCLPQFKPMHPALLKFFKGYENQFSKTDIVSIKTAVTKRFEKERQEVVRRDEGSIDTSEQGLKVKANKEVWDEKTTKEIKSLEKNINRPLKECHEIKSVHGMVAKTVVNYLCGLQAKILKMEELKDKGDKQSIEKLEKTMDKKEMPHDLVVFVRFATGAKFDRFVKGGGSGAPEKIKAIKTVAGRMIDGTLSIIPIDPRISKE